MTELIWDGKYKDGKKTAPVRIALPFQNIETVNESTADRQKNLELFTNNKQTEWRNRLIWGDKKFVLPSLLPEFSGKVNLIYIDPPFNVGADFSFKATIPDNPETEEDETIQFVKQPNLIEQKAYRDTWGKGLDSYLQWFYETIIMLRELLADDGSVYVHLDWHVSHYAKSVMDEIFGYDNFRNEIIWRRVYTHSDANRYGHIHDTILFYTKSENYCWNNLFTAHTDKYLDSHYKQKDEDGKSFQLISMSAKTGKQEIRIIDGKEYLPEGNAWKYSQKTIDKYWQEGKIFFTAQGTPRLKLYLDETEGRKIQSIWTDIFPVNSQALERVDYSTQKPETLLDRIIKASSNENDLVLDCFAGSGTTASVAEKINRRWIACDLGRFAIHTTRKRLLEIENLKPFVVQNLGKYERQQWISAEFTSAESRMNQELSYRNFILELYHAQPVTGYNWLHGSKSGRMIHVGSVDSPVSIGDVKSIIQEFWKIVGKSKDIQTNGVDVIGWDFAFEINETARQYAAENKVDLKFKKIPREVLEKRAVEQGDIQFFELASLDIKTEVKGKDLTITLNNFIIPPDDIPEEVRQAITHWQQCVDYWAIDWNYRDDTFHNEWQSYRTKKDPNIVLTTKHTYEEKGKYIVVVKAIDILGNDTTKALTINIK
jgi:DNA modification methylase